MDSYGSAPFCNDCRCPAYNTGEYWVCTQCGVVQDQIYSDYVRYDHYGANHENNVVEPVYSPVHDASLDITYRCTPSFHIQKTVHYAYDYPLINEKYHNRRIQQLFGRQLCLPHPCLPLIRRCVQPYFSKNEIRRWQRCDLRTLFEQLQAFGFSQQRRYRWMQLGS